MNLLNRLRPGSGAAPPAPAEPITPQTEHASTGTTHPASVAPSSPGAVARPVPATRTSVVWAGVWAGALVAVAFIVFMLQNTSTTQVSFLGLHGTLPLAVALLIAMITGVLLTLILGTARITQLRRLARRRLSRERGQ